jgi:SAM-dependent methyltransferase
VRPGGQVTALDLDPRHLDDGGVVEVRPGDVRTVDLPAGHYDLIHVRLLLLHLAERDEVLRRLVAALAPGGIIVVSDWAGTDRDWLLRVASPAHTEAFTAFQDGLLGILEDHGADLGWARRAPLARDALLGRGVTTQQLDLLEDAMTDPTTLAYCYAMFSSVARRPQ